MTWIWTLPLVLGWFAVGTQRQRNSINQTLNRAKKLLQIPDYVARGLNPISAIPQADDEVDDKIALKRAYSWGIRDWRGPFSQFPETSIDGPERWLGSRIAGDMERPGPIFNFARIYTWQQVAASIIDAHRNGRLDPVPDGIADLETHCFGLNTETQGQDNPFHSPSRAMTLRAEEGAANARQSAVGPGGAIKWLIVASVFHLVITIPAFLTAYFTPPVGLGCRSGSILLYFCASLLSAVLLAFSARMSRKWFELKDLRGQGSSGLLGSVVATMAVTTRYMGTWLAYGNSLWIIVYCVFEFTGFFQRCWCDALSIVHGNNGWITFFTTEQIKDAVLDWWIACLGLSWLALCVTSFLVLWLPWDYIQVGMADD
jgi:hypothetical protein